MYGLWLCPAHIPRYSDKNRPHLVQCRLPANGAVVVWLGCRAVLDDLETMWQAASRDNRRMQETMQRNARKLQQHLRACQSSPQDGITAVASDDAEHSGALDVHTDIDA